MLHMHDGKRVSFGLAVVAGLSVLGTVALAQRARLRRSWSTS